MVSGGEKPDLDALRELEAVLHHLESELASWRRRALAAEQRVTEVTHAAGPEGALLTKRLEDENRELERRLETARFRVADLLDRLRFLEEQRGNGGTER
jgi:hypothetical protein